MKPSENNYKGAFFLLLLSVFMTVTQGVAQNEQGTDEDAFFIRTIFDKALTEGKCYPWIEHLTTKIGGRLAGSPQAAAAVEYTYQMLDTLNLDKVWRQPCTVPHWVRGAKEIIRISNSVMGSVELQALALGNSVGTDPHGISAQVVEVKSLDEVEELGRENIEGKIVFYNRPLDPTQLNTFAAYGGAVDQRGSGASKASKYGAIGVLVRSMTTKLDDVPHTGGLGYREGVNPIPAAAISTNNAEMLSSLLKRGEVSVYMKMNCGMLSPKPSYNVIGEIKGSEFPNEIILVGGHLDSWDIGSGAHDDGAGCVQSMDVLQILKRMNYQPKRTIRCVLFMNEENGLAGAKEYQKVSYEKGEFHVAAIESDRGGFTPRGFTMDGHPDIFKEKAKKVTAWLPLLEPYGLSFQKGGSGADIGGLKDQKGMLFGFYPDSQRYFDYHHTADDNFDAVNKRELELGVATMTSLVFLIDKYGL
ncbi:M20/M25/M40 family metallo-hydrolase [Saprospiraceae bacterium]|jgi:hypothetical protein|nr:M20/M25/M40 family metallo-hydrolase [Bacteroidota bacterium]MDB4727461.1 M20/M25/M40 family metallo-hydrolase [Saprospiraceae bacterium]MDF1865412.1 M20/M25/M40 family metallo-hydrolase [Saprospiraceae bacterium]